MDHETTRREFTSKADLYMTSAQLTSPDLVGPLIEAVDPRPRDAALDVACGTGIVARALAPKVARVTGIDLTPAMLEKAKEAAAAEGLDNAEWDVGDVENLPYADGTFDVVTARYAFHHFDRPARVLAEMLRVGRNPERLAIADVVASSDAQKAAAFNRMERMRDPSHVRALTFEEWGGLFADFGLRLQVATWYRVEFELEYLLAGSSAGEAEAVQIRELFQAALRDDGLGVPVEEREGRLYFSYPIAIFAASAKGNGDGTRG